MRVALIYGGRSSEHEVSLRSAANVRTTLAKAGHDIVDMAISAEGRWLTGPDARTLLAAGPVPTPDGPHLPDRDTRRVLAEVEVVFPVLHGPHGEDGTVQGLLELAGLPYVGSGVLGSALAMDKAVARPLLQAAGLPMVAHRTLRLDTAEDVARQDPDALAADLGLPLFVKPANMGSSVGVSRVDALAGLLPALRHARQFDNKVLVETAVRNARELEVSVLGDRNPEASLPGEVRPGNDFYDYEAKYADTGSELLVPAPIPDEMTAALQAMSIRAFKTLDCCGMARVDFLVDPLDLTIHLNEVNTIPGFTSISMYPKMWEASGLSYPDLLNRLLDIAVARHQRKQRLKTTL